MRRRLVVAAALAAAGCGPQSSAPPKVEPAAAEVAFDGAGASDPATRIAHGDRLSWTLGCRGCHGEELQGQRFYETYAANLTRKMPTLSDAEFERILRHGTPDGKELWGMPSELFQHLSAADLAALTAYLRTLKPDGPKDQPRLPWEPETAKLIAQGKIKPAAAFVRETRTVGPVDLGSDYALGRYITRVGCAECHGPKLEGIPGDTPDLAVVGAYTREEFEQLIMKGVPTGGRKLKELMQDVAVNRYSRLTGNERDALYSYLKARAEQPR